MNNAWDPLKKHKRSSQKKKRKKKKRETQKRGRYPNRYLLSIWK